MGVQDFAATNDAVGVIDNDVQCHVACKAQETKPGESLLEMTLVPSCPELLCRPREYQEDLEDVDYKDAIGAETKLFLKSKVLGDAEWHFNRFHPEVSLAEIGRNEADA